MEDFRTNDRRPRDFLKKQGFYVVLFICLLIVGTAVALTLIPRDNQVTPEAEQTAPQQAVIETRQNADETLKAKNTPLPSVTPVPTPTPTPVPTPRVSSGGTTVKKGTAPVSGEVIWTFANEQLLYSRTLDQWTTHSGIDLSAEIGSDVKATLAGTVEKVYQDDALGQVVTIAHTNGRTSLYANLDPTVSVKEGQKVNAGDLLGKVGSTSVSECGDLPHLHFAFFVDGKSVNPADYVAISH